MFKTVAIPNLSPPIAATWLTRTIDWFTAARSHRVICLVMGLWVFSIFDVALTMLAHEQGMLDESNPIARRLLNSPPAIMLYKLSLVTFASTIILSNRRRLVAELAAGGVLAVYTIVAIQWRLCYELYVLTHIGDIRSQEIDAIDLTILTSSAPLF